MKIKVGIVGLGNLGRACIEQINQRNKEFELVAVFSRRQVPNTVPLDAVDKYKGKIDVMLVCVGSSDDAPTIVPQIAQKFNTVDSFDTHAKLADYITHIKSAQQTDSNGKTSKPRTTAIIATGWDPGLLSIMRLYLCAFINSGTHQTFWGPGVSMGHTNAIKQLKGVHDAIQFTVPKQEAVASAKKGKQVDGAQRHKRVCYVVADEKLHTTITEQIKTMPNYFAPYQTEVNFISQSEFNKKYKNRNEHAGQVISVDKKSAASFALKLKSNAHFTAQIMLAFTVANYNLRREGKTGVFTVADIAPKYLFSDDIIHLI